MSKRRRVLKKISSKKYKSTQSLILTIYYLSETENDLQRKQLIKKFPLNEYTLDEIRNYITINFDENLNHINSMIILKRVFQNPMYKDLITKTFCLDEIQLATDLEINKI